MGLPPTANSGFAALQDSPGRRFEPGAAANARIQGAFGIGAAAIGLIGVLLPHPAAFDDLGLVVIQLSSLGIGIALLARPARVPRWALRVLPATAISLTTLAIWFTRDATSAFALFYLWPALFAFYLLSWREVAFTIGFAIANYAAALLFVQGPTASPAGSKMHHLVVLAGTLVVAGSLLLYLRGRVERLMGRLTDAARTDLLTDLPNARALNEVLTTELERAQLVGSSVGVLVADVDRLRIVNEEHGRRSGDEVLRRIGALLREATRRIDTVARTGAGEFTIVLPESSEADAYLLAEQLLGRVRRGEEFTTLTMSIGIAAYPARAATVEELLKLAERALKAAKTLGRDRAVVSSPEVLEVLSGALEGKLDTTAHLATLVSLVEVLDLRDGGAGGRSKKVGACAESIARELGLNDFRTERVRLAGILHDVGKLGVPEAILRKPGPLEEGEWEQVRKHPEIGARILGARELADIREWVLASRERPDGTGYPRGLAGEEIPLEARILAVASAFEAMSGGRIYRPAIGEPAAREELLAGAGTQFDPEVVDALLRALDRVRQASGVS